MHMISYNIPKMDQVAERLCASVHLTSSSVDLFANSMHSVCCIHSVLSTYR
jgi:hypothetical protein